VVLELQPAKVLSGLARGGLPAGVTLIDTAAYGTGHSERVVGAIELGLTRWDRSSVAFSLDATDNE
jgi:hypothetical protein